MKSKFLLILFLFFASFKALAIEKPMLRIVTSITPLASIAQLLVKDLASISAIVTTNACPHHYSSKVSDLEKVRSADIIIYIDEQFDGFAAKLIRTHQVNNLKISSFTGLKIIKNNNQINWHLWLDLSNVEIILIQLAKELIKLKPELEKDINYNLQQSRNQLKELKTIKQNLLTTLPSLVLLNDSVEYFFIDNPKHDITNLYEPKNKSLYYMTKLETLVRSKEQPCLILSQEQNPQIYQKFERPIIQLTSENWTLADGVLLPFYNQYLKMIQQVASCPEK